MLGSAIIGVMVGLVFVYILLSLLVMQINQIIANMLKLRAHSLRNRVEQLIFDSDLQERLLSHPVVGIIRPPVTDEEAQDRRQRTTSVNNLAANAFAKALINILSDPFLEIYAAVNEVKNPEERDRLLDIVNTLRSNLEDPQRTQAVLTNLYETVEALEPLNREDRQEILSTLSFLQSGVKDIQSGNSDLLRLLSGIQRVDNRAFQQTMETVLSGVQDLKEIETAIEEWYNNKMAQTSDMYARYMQLLSLGIGLLLALLLNIDSLHLARTLWLDDALRDQVNLAATAALEDFDGTFALSTGNAEVVVDGDDSGTTDQATSEEAIREIVSSYEEAQTILTNLLELNLPIGWTYRVASEGTTESGETSDAAFYNSLEDPRNFYSLLPVAPGWYQRLPIKIVGLAITAFAVAQGAPFWFDLLRRIAGQTSPSNTTPQPGATRGQSA